MRLRRAKPEFDLEIPDGFPVYHDTDGCDLMLCIGAPLGDPQATVIGVTKGERAASREEHVARVRAARPEAQLVDEAPMPLAGLESWWTIDTSVVAQDTLVRDSWMLVRSGVGWTVTAQLPWTQVNRQRKGAIAIVSTLRFL
ncbi:hypothetical protein DVA67_025355 [Solirubrobacter sp. CPCC 204708]|uniref:DUF1795 domain-containing protein n=1 Tax=Solirubrobacter deserti TaxID=2282478 RepID=A0ABT4RUR5_9ACTN|nr:hypothetical protein [Solirubrobacter deserti]MBE2319329.1 hypothetical protein [Solirubrobacter deserti]MDA0142309.1 hypothetical protein [Solirubrobacter deserti]